MVLMMLSVLSLTFFFDCLHSSTSFSACLRIIRQSSELGQWKISLQIAPCMSRSWNRRTSSMSNLQVGKDCENWQWLKKVLPLSVLFVCWRTRRQEIMEPQFFSPPCWLHSAHIFTKKSNTNMQLQLVSTLLESFWCNQMSKQWVNQLMYRPYYQHGSAAAVKAALDRLVQLGSEPAERFLSLFLLIFLHCLLESTRPVNHLGVNRN